MEGTNHFSNNILLKTESKDFISENLVEEELQIKQDMRKRKMTIIGLGSVYVLLILASLIILT